MLEKLFTTKMSADKRKLQNRFFKIRSENGKISKLFGGILFAILIITIIGTGIIIAVNNTKETSDSFDVYKLYEFKGTAFQDKSAIESIVKLNDYLPYAFHSVEIPESEYGNRIMVKFLVEDRAMHRTIDTASLKKMSAIILALVPEAEAVSSFLFDKYSENINNYEASFYGNYISRTDLCTMIDFEKFTPEYIDNSTLSIENFEEYCLKLSSVVSLHKIDDYIKGMYDFIGNDYEIVLNSGIGAEFLVDKDFLNSSEYTEINKLFNVDLKKYEGFALQLNKQSIRNFKTNEYKKHIILHYNTGVETTIIKQKIIDKTDAEKAKLLIQKLMKKTDGMVISNAENMTYTQVKALQYQVNNGHFPWRLDYNQVISMFISGLGENVENGKLINFAGDGGKCAGTYVVGNKKYDIELFKPIDKSEHGIWIVRSCNTVMPAEITNVSFYNINPVDNTLNGEVNKQDGWYNLEPVTGMFVNYVGGVPESVTVYLTPTGTEMDKYKKQVGYAQPPFEQIPISIKLEFSKEDTTGHLQFVFNYNDGTYVESELFNVMIKQ